VQTTRNRELWRNECVCGAFECVCNWVQWFDFVRVDGKLPESLPTAVSAGDALTAQGILLTN
jgi:hypothetical protein